MKEKSLSPAQKRALNKFNPGDVKSAYEAKERITTLRILVKNGFLKDVTPPEIRGMFFPRKLIIKFTRS